jgi:methionine-R-sulfoxide reductase
MEPTENSNIETTKTYPSTEEAKKLSEQDWKQILTEQEYKVLWESGTERSYTGDLLNNKEQGVYVTAGCGLPVFTSKTKYDSKTGWPSFYDVIEENIILQEDNSLFTKRVEILSTCGEHLGHVFTDGPEPTGLRYCINGPVAKRTSQRSDENSEKHPIFQSFYRRETTLFSTVNI